MADKKLTSAALAAMGLANATLTPVKTLPVGDAGPQDQTMGDGTWMINDINADKATGMGRSYRATNSAYPKTVFNLISAQTFTKARQALAEADIAVKSVTDVIGYEFTGPAVVTVNWVQSTVKGSDAPLVVKADDGTDCWVWGKQITARPTGTWEFASKPNISGHLDLDQNARSTGVLLAGALRDMDHAFGGQASGEIARQFSVAEYS